MGCFAVLRSLHWFREIIHCSLFLSTSFKTTVPSVPFAAVNCTIFLPRLHSSLHSSSHKSWLKHDCKIWRRQRWLQDLGRVKFGSQVEFDFYIVGQRDQVAKAFIWLSAVLRRPGEERATLPQPSCHLDLQLHIQGLFKTLTVSCKTDLRNSPVQDEIWISWLAIIFSGFHIPPPPPLVFFPYGELLRLLTCR